MKLLVTAGGRGFRDAQGRPVVRGLRERRAPVSFEQIAAFETDVLAGFVLPRASAGLADATIRSDVGHVEQARAWFGRPSCEMEPSDADAYFGRVLRSTAKGTTAGPAHRCSPPNATTSMAAAGGLVTMPCAPAWPRRPPRTCLVGWTSSPRTSCDDLVARLRRPWGVAGAGLTVQLVVWSWLSCADRVRPPSTRKGALPREPSSRGRSRQRRPSIPVTGTPCNAHRVRGPRCAMTGEIRFRVS
jgi:hypothetical protein